MQRTSTHVLIECQGTTWDHLASMNYDTIDEYSIYLVKPLPRYGHCGLNLGNSVRLYHKTNYYCSLADEK